MSAVMYAIFGILSLISLVSSPFLLAGMMTKIRDHEKPSWECLWLAAGGFCIWFWLFIVFGSLPAP